MSKRSSERRGRTHRRNVEAGRDRNAPNHEQRRDRQRTKRYRALSRMTWGDANAARHDSGNLPEMRDGVMHSGYSPGKVYNRRNGAVVTGITSVSDRQLYGTRLGEYRQMRDAAKIAKREEQRAIVAAARAERAKQEALRAKREGSGWA